MAEEQNINRARKKLNNYSALDGLNGFLEKIVDNAKCFDIISATERRCYNIVVRFLPFLSIVSNNALLLMYKEMADRYEETGELPKILIIDDIMIHGRGLSKFLYRFETVIIEELQRRGHLSLPEDLIYFRMQFTQAVTIYIYAKNAGALLLAPRFLSRMEPWEEMHVGKLRDLSMQLSDCLSRWDIANTSFTYSIRDADLAGRIESLFDRIYNNNTSEKESLHDLLVREYRKCPEPSVDLSKKWVPLVWKYNDEDMYIFTRLYGEKEIERISIIRYFPRRKYRKEPLIISYSILGDISMDTLDSVCKACAESLPCHRTLNSILLNSNKEIGDVKGQLLSTLLSIVDFGDFCKTTFGQFFSCEYVLKEELQKIARNYNVSFACFEEMDEIVCSMHNQTILSNVFNEHLFKKVSPLIDLDIAKCNELRLTINAIDRINPIVDKYIKRSIYRLGVEAEKQAFIAEMNPEAFQADAYASPVFEDDKPDLSHGILPLRICAKDLARLFKRKFSADSVYCLLASVISAMDNGIISVRQAIEKNKLVSMAKAGEMAVFYIPSKFSLFVPAFAEIEEKFYGNQQTLVGKITSFVEAFFRQDAESKRRVVNESMLEAFSEEDKEAIIDSLRKTFGVQTRYLKDLLVFYECGHSFREWNFLNLTNQEQHGLMVFQGLIIDMAKQFK